MLSVLNRFRRRPEPVILMYHRVAEPRLDPWEMAVSAKHFTSQIEMLADQRTVLPLAEFVALQSTDRLPRDAIAVTFDDGYADNTRTAVPILAASGMPATLFVATAYVGREREFWWDELARLVLLHPGGANWAFEGSDLVFGEDDHLAGDMPWRGWDTPSTSRQRAYLELWRVLRPRALPRIEAALKLLAQVSGAPAAPREDLPVTAEVLSACAGAGQMSLAAHTHTHRPLVSIGMDEARAEITAGLTALRDLAGVDIVGMSYPYGDCTPAVAAVAREAGIVWACTTRKAPVRRQDQPLLLPRVAVRNQSGEELLRYLHAVCGERS